MDEIMQKRAEEIAQEYFPDMKRIEKLYSISRIKHELKMAYYEGQKNMLDHWMKSFEERTQHGKS